jgi:hypothetical protein
MFAQGVILYLYLTSNGSDVVGAAGVLVNLEYLIRSLQVATECNLVGYTAIQMQERRIS